MIKLISAISLNNVIGKENKLCWHYSQDLKRFKQLTTNSTVVMGATTFLYDLNSRPLDKRNNIVLSTKLSKSDYSQVTVCRNLKEVLDIIDNNCWVIGGKSIYELFLPIVELMEITHINKAFVGDSYFNIDYSQWKLSKQQQDNELTYCTYTK